MKRLLRSMLICVAIILFGSVNVFATDTVTANNIVYSTDFEDGDISKFTKRGYGSLSVTNSEAYDGEYSMLVSNRQEAWYGVAYDAWKYCTPGKEYFINAKLKSSTSVPIKMNYRYTDANGSGVFSTLGTYEGEGWLDVKNVRFIYSEDMADIQIIWATDTAGDDIYIDDFSIKEAKIQDELMSLKDKYLEYFDHFGTIVPAKAIDFPNTQKLVLKHFDSLTPDFAAEMFLDKEASLALGDYTNPQVTIPESTRKVLDFCRDNNLDVKGQGFVWYDRTPDWLFKENFDENADWVDKETMKLRLENYIKNVVTILENEYPTVNIYAWDVVNEAWLDDGSHRHGGSGDEKYHGLNCSPWVQVFGDNSFIEYAFTYARKYVPETTKLYYADFNEYIDAKKEAIINMAVELKNKGVLDGVALQGHIAVNKPTVEVYRKAIDDYAKAGLDIMISELDVELGDYTLEEQGEYYKEIMSVFVEYSDSISNIAIWGTTDDLSWKASEFPLLFNADYTAKPAYYALANLQSNPKLLGTVQVFGSPIVGNTITTNISGLNYNGALEGTIEYQWYRGNTLIESAQDSTYQITNEDINQPIKVKVTNSNNVGSVSSEPVIVQISNNSLIYSTDFEDGDISKFTRRGYGSLSVTNSEAYSGEYSMLVSNRGEAWYGVAYDAWKYCTPGKEYFINAKLKSSTSVPIKMNYRYTDANGSGVFSTLGTYEGEGWLDVKDVRFIYSEDMADIQIIWATDTAGDDIYIDDFSIKEAKIQDELMSLKDKYLEYFDHFGTVVPEKAIHLPVTKELTLKHFDSLIPDFSPEMLLDKEASLATGNYINPQISLSAKAREVLDFCRDNNLSVKGQVLVWHDRTPDWFFKENYDENADWVSKEVMLLRMENYIKNVVETLYEEYPTIDFYAWNVVNEALLDNGNYRSHCTTSVEDKVNGLTCSAWTTIFGDNSFIEYAFTYARKYTKEGTLLYYNDFNEYIPTKRDAIINLVNELKEKDLIDSIGLQSHLSLDSDIIANYKEAIDLYIATGVDVQITELDIVVSDSEIEEQAELYSDLMKFYVERCDKISNVAIWGTTDDLSWKASEFPLLFNADYTAKPAYYALANIDKESKIKGNVKIIGSPIIGETLTVDISGLNYNGEAKGTIEYQWYRGDNLIIGATNNTYRITNEDINNTIKVKVSNSNNVGTVSSLSTSIITEEGTVVLPEIPSIRGNVNPPMLAAGLTPVIYSNGNWIITEYTNENWYDYENGIWANAMSDDESIYVWIPRFTYKIYDGNIFIKFSEGKNDDTDDGYLRHPAFYLGGYNGGDPNVNLNFNERNGVRRELTGFWVQKYLASGDEYIQSVSNGAPKLVSLNEAFEESLKMTSDIRYGFEQTGTYTHLMKASEWGALAYLTKAKGSANSAISTTGNIYGVCDINSDMSQYVAAVVGTPENSGNMLQEGYTDYCDVITLTNTNSEINNTNRLEDYYGFAISETNSMGAATRTIPHFTTGSPNNAYFIRGGSSLGLFGYVGSDGENENIGFRTTISIVPEESNKDIAFFDTETSLMEGDYLVISVDFTVDKKWRFIDNDGDNIISDDDLFKDYEVEENIISNANIDLECIYGAGEWIIEDLNPALIKLIKPVTDGNSEEEKLEIESDLNQWFAPGKYTMAVRVGGKIGEEPVFRKIENLTAKIIINEISLEDEDENKIKISKIANNKVLLNIYGQSGTNVVTEAVLNSVPTKVDYALREEFTNTSLIGGTIVLVWGNAKSRPINLTVDNIVNKDVTSTPGENKLVELKYNDVIVKQDEVQFLINVSDVPNIEVIGRVSPEGIGSILYGTGVYERNDEDYTERLLAKDYLAGYKFVNWSSSSSQIKPINLNSYDTEFIIPSKDRFISENKITFTANYMGPTKLEIIDPKTEFIINDRFSIGDGRIVLTYPDGTTKIVDPAEVNFTPFRLNDKLVVGGWFTVTVEYANLTATYDIEVVRAKRNLKIQVEALDDGNVIRGNVVDERNNPKLTIEVPDNDSNTINYSVSVGNEVTLQANSIDGYRLAEWIYDPENILSEEDLEEGVEISRIKFTMPDEDVTIIGRFAETYTVTYTVNDSQRGYIEGDAVQEVMRGQSTSEVTAKPLSDRYAFSNWIEGGSTNPTRKDGNIKADATYTANFINVWKVRFFKDTELICEIMVKDGANALLMLPDLSAKLIKDEGYSVFAKWDKEEELKAVHSDLDVYAQWVPRLSIEPLELKPGERNLIHAEIKGNMIIEGTLQYIITDSPDYPDYIYFSEELEGYEFISDDWGKLDNMYRSKEGLGKKEDASAYLIMPSSNSKEIIRFDYLLSGSDDSQLGITINGDRVVGPDREISGWQTFIKEVNVVDGKIKVGISYSQGENSLESDYAAIRNLCIIRQWITIDNPTTIKVPTLYENNYIHARGNGSDTGPLYRKLYKIVSDPIVGMVPEEKIASISLTNITLNKTGSTNPTALLNPIVLPVQVDNSALTWSSSDTSVATVDSNGVVTWVGIGETIIIASSGEIQGACVVTCTQTLEDILRVEGIYSDKTPKVVSKTAEMDLDLTDVSTLTFDLNSEIGLGNTIGITVSLIVDGQTIYSDGRYKSTCTWDVSSITNAKLRLYAYARGGYAYKWGGYNFDAWESSIHSVTVTNIKLEP